MSRPASSPIPTPTGTLQLVPAVTGPVPATPTGHQFNSTRTYPVPLDLGDHGYVEEEFFVTGRAAVYGDPGVTTVPYTNRVIVRRPAEGTASSGVVVLEILNASNGYDAEGLWRRAWDHCLAERHTYVAFTAKPVAVDSLTIFDPVRYAPLSWDLDPAAPHEPVQSRTDAPFDYMGGVVEGAEEGLIWDIITQMGNLLRNPAGAPVLGGFPPTVLLLGGQSQSGAVLNTWIRHFDGPTRNKAGRTLFDGYLVSVASIVERPLRQQASPDGFFATIAPTEPPPVDIPTITVTCEGDVNLWAALGHDYIGRPGLADGEWRRNWCVAGAPHTEVGSRVMPAPEELLRAGRNPRVMTPAQVARGNIFPLSATVTAAIDALIAWIVDGTPAPPSLWFEVDDDGTPARDDHGNVRGGLRYGLIEHAIATFIGSPGGATLGAMELDPADGVLARFPTLASYLAAVTAVDDLLAERGYLGAIGRQQMVEAATELWTRATST